MSLRDLPKVRDSLSYVYVEHARIDRSQSAVAVHDETGEVHVPCAALAAVLLGPGTRITHAAVKTLAEAGCSIVWVGEGTTRVYAQGIGETRSSRRLLVQVQCHADRARRAAVVRRMYESRFDEPPPPEASIEQVRGLEGVRVRTTYARMSKEFGVPWHGRRYKRGKWDAADAVNQALSAAASCLYGVCHAAIVSAGYSTALGFVHTGKLLSFVYDIADLYRMETAVPAAFASAAEFQAESNLAGLSRLVRRRCRDTFRDQRLMSRIVADIDRLFDLSADEVEAASAWVDDEVEGVGGLWTPNDGSIPGGVNHGDPDPGAGPDGTAG